MKKKVQKEPKNEIGKVNVENTLREIRTKFGDDAIMMLGDKTHVDVNAISTGSIGRQAGLPHLLMPNTPWIRNTQNAWV